MQDITPFLPGDSIAFLRLADSGSRFPFRPLTEGLFLIGRGPGCDLRIGFEAFPAIHSVIQADSNHVEILRIAESPELLVNGESLSHSELQHGDLIEIADIRMVYNSCQPAVLAGVSATPEAKDLNARQLVDGIEAELKLVSSEGIVRDRVHELLRAAQQAIESSAFAQTLRFEDYVPKPSRTEETAAEDFRHVVLSRLSAQETRLDEICHVLEQVVNQQQMIATALQCVASRLDELSPATAATARRAS